MNNNGVRKEEDSEYKALRRVAGMEWNRRERWRSRAVWRRRPTGVH